MNEEDILQKWDKNGKEAAGMGTWMHWKIEAYLNGVPVETTSHEMSLFKKFISTLKSQKAFRTEMIVYSRSARLSGSIDFISVCRDGRLCLYDWKRSKDLRQHYHSFGGQKMLHPVAHLEDCKGIHYRLQMNLYRKILMKEYGFEVASMSVVCFHPDNGDVPFVDNVPVMDSEADAMMETMQRRAWETDRMADEDFLDMDPLIG